VVHGRKADRTNPGPLLPGRRGRGTLRITTNSDPCK
jgi:hypothetical protein